MFTALHPYSYTSLLLFMFTARLSLHIHIHISTFLHPDSQQMHISTFLGPHPHLHIATTTYLHFHIDTSTFLHPHPYHIHDYIHSQGCHSIWKSGKPGNVREFGSTLKSQGKVGEFRGTSGKIQGLLTNFSFFKSIYIII